MIYKEDAQVNNDGECGETSIRICGDGASGCGFGRNYCNQGGKCSLDECRGGAEGCRQQHCGINIEELMDKINGAILQSKTKYKSANGGGFKMENEEKKEDLPEDVSRR